MKKIKLLFYMAFAVVSLQANAQQTSIYGVYNSTPEVRRCSLAVAPIDFTSNIIKVESVGSCPLGKAEISLFEKDGEYISIKTQTVEYEEYKITFSENQMVINRTDRDPVTVLKIN